MGLLGVVLSLLAPVPLAAQTAPAVSEARVVLQASGDEHTIGLRGQGLDAFTEVRIVPVDGRTRPDGIKAALGALQRDTRSLSFSTSPGAPAGDFTVQLVTSRGDAVKIDFTLTVDAVDAPPEVADIAAPRSVEAGQRLRLSVTALDDQALSELRVEWVGGSTVVRLRGETKEIGEVVVEGLASGSQSLEVVAVDRAGNLSDPVAVTVMVMADQPPTVVSVDSPSEVTVGEDLTVSVSADDDLGLATVQLVWVGGSATAPAAGTSDTATLAISGLSAGVHEMVVTAVDAAGNTSDPITVTVESLEVVAPTLAGLSLSGATVERTQAFSGTVTLDVPAPTDVTVALSATPLVTVPSSVTVMAGARSATFDGVAGPDAGGAAVTASYGDDQQQAIVEVLATTPAYDPVVVPAGLFQFTLDPIVEAASFDPVVVPAGVFQFTLDPIVEAASFDPIVIPVGTFQFTLDPNVPGGGDRPDQPDYDGANP